MKRCPSVCSPLLLCLAVTACSSTSRDTDDGGGFGVATDGTNVTGGPADGSSTNASADESGPGAVRLDLPPAMETEGPVDDDEEEECASTTITADNRLQPADIIFIVDTSGSMSEENQAVQDNLNAFSQQIIDSGVDARVVLIAEDPIIRTILFQQYRFGICVEPPLGSGGCMQDPPIDNNPPLYTHVNEYINSNDALERLVELEQQWRDVIRPDAALHLVVVSDDEASPQRSDDDEASYAAKATAFDMEFTALNPDYAGYLFHGIVSKQECADAAHIGGTYIRLGEVTGGIVADLCDQDFDPVFNELATAVVEGSTLSCEWAIPSPPEGEVFDRDRVNVNYDDGVNATELIGRVDSASECSSVAQGWYYDDPVNPTTILACPQTCDWMREAQQPSVGISLGCATESAPPVG